MQSKKSSLDSARIAARLAADKKAEDITILDIGKVSNICDYFVIVSAESTRKVKTIAETIEEELEKQGIKVMHSEGYNDCLWILLDTQDIIIHVFRSDLREFYALERLWSQAPEVSLR